MHRTLSSAFPRLARVLDPRGVVRWRDGATAAARDSRCIRPTSTSAVEEGWESHGDDVSAMVELDGPPLLSAALKAPDDLVALLSAADGEDFVDRVHRLSARSEGIVELPDELERAVRVAVRDTGATHRQVKARGRSLLESLKSISRGMPPRRGRRWRQRVDPSEAPPTTLWPRRRRRPPRQCPVGRAIVRAEAQTHARGSGGQRRVGGERVYQARESAKKPPKPGEAAAAYGPLEELQRTLSRDFR